ncbi:TPA: hypothetical protein NIH49_001635 [Pseudomonas aeruginosa]|nr:hypothetical protein [Pseudomonas aeruginosa]HCT6920555.1 hypothetical protein [Pseudomonas aeruginosa]
MSSTQHQLIEQCATRLRGIVEALDNIHDTSPHRWSTDLDDVHSSAESLLALINDQAPTLDSQGLALRTIAEYPCPEQDNMTATNMRQVAADAITGALAFGAQASQPPAADHWLRPFYDIGRAEGQRTQDLAMLVRMLASSLKRHAPESNLVARATNYLAAKGLAGTPLRDAPASVEQAGGDERAAFESRAEDAGSDISRDDFGNYVNVYVQTEWDGWQARAALAQPSPASDLDPLNLAPHAGAFNEAPDEALRPEQAEAERPEVVDFNPYRYHAEKIRQRADGAASAYEAGRSALGYMEDIAESALIVRNGLDELSAQHERIVGALRFERQQMDRAFTACINERDAANARLHEVATACATAEQERDAALAKLAELERQEPAGWLAYHFGGKWNGKIYGGPCDTKEEINRYIQQVHQSNDSVTLQGKPFYAAPVAQAQQLHDLDKQCRDDVARALGLRPSQERGFA